MPQGGTVNKNSNRTSTISGSKGAPILVHENSPKFVCVLLFHVLY
jgi:hypothetical protein